MTDPKPNSWGPLSEAEIAAIKAAKSYGEAAAVLRAHDPLLGSGLGNAAAAPGEQPGYYRIVLTGTITYAARASLTLWAHDADDAVARAEALADDDSKIDWEIDHNYKRQLDDFGVETARLVRYLPDAPEAEPGQSDLLEAVADA